MNESPPRSIVLITALACEARPIISALGLQPLREHPIGERFQVFSSEGVYLAVSGIGKLRSAIATSAVVSNLFERAPAPIVANVGIAGTSATDIELGTTVYVTNTQDDSSHGTLYADILIQHGLVELPLHTYDHPVTTPPLGRVLVDMEGFGFMQAALTLVPPSNVCVLKVVSDYCQGGGITKERCSKLLEESATTISKTLHALQSALPEPRQLLQSERDLIDAVTSHAGLSLTQRIELHRQLVALKSRGIHFSDDLRSVLGTPITSKETRNAVYHKLLATLSENMVL